MFKQFSIISVLILMFTIVANANDVTLLKNAEDTDQRMSGISKSLFISDLTKLSICASLQENIIDSFVLGEERVIQLFDDNKYHLHAAWHPEPVLNDISSWMASLYSKNFIDKMSQKSQVKFGQLLYSFNNYHKRKPHEVFCSATREKEPCGIDSIETLELSCMRSLINVHMEYGSLIDRTTYGQIIMRTPANLVKKKYKYCRPENLLTSAASHHENEKKLKNFINKNIKNGTIDADNTC